MVVPVAGLEVVPVAGLELAGRSARGRSPAGPSAAAGIGAAGGGGPAKSAAPAAAVTRVRNSLMEAAPPPSGWTRFVRMMRYERLCGSIHTEVPVNPVCPTEPEGKKGAMPAE